MSGDLVELFRAVGDVCEILGKLTEPLQRLATELESKPAIATPKKAQRWTQADTTAFSEAREKFGDDPEKIQAALPKKQLQDIQKRLDKLKKDETKKRKQTESVEENTSKKVHKSDSDNETQKTAPPPIQTRGDVSPAKNTKPPKSTSSKINKDLSKVLKKEPPSPLAPSPALGDSDGASSDEFG